MHLSAAILELAESQSGLVFASQVAALGLSRHSVSRMRRSGDWQPLTRRVLARCGTPSDERSGLIAAVLDSPGNAAISHNTAAYWWGLTGCPLRPVTVQSERHHTALSDIFADQKRRESLENSGFVVSEVWDAAAFASPALVVDQVRVALDEARLR